MDDMDAQDDKQPEETVKRLVGRPTVCTREVVAGFSRLMAAGNYFVTACNYLGIDETSAYEWLKAGAEGRDAPGDWPDAYREFSQSVKRAEAQAEVAAVAEVQMAGKPHAARFDAEGNELLPGQWQASMTFLERRHRDRWGRGERVELTGANGGPVALDVSVGVEDVLANDAATELACQLAEELASPGEAHPGDVCEGDK